MRRLIPLVLALSLGACTTVPPLPEHPPEQLESFWQQHIQAVGKITAWSLTGRIVVNTEDDGWSGELRWAQSPEDFQIQFNAPFGQGAFKIFGDNTGVEMRLSDGQVYRAPNAETLLQDHVGWQLPLGEFRHWVTGVPVGQFHSGKILNNSGLLMEFKQDQWRIRYPEYFAVGEVLMPRKVFFKNHALSVRLVIDQWTIESGSEVHQQIFDDGFLSPYE